MNTTQTEAQKLDAALRPRLMAELDLELRQDDAQLLERLVGHG